MPFGGSPDPTPSSPEEIKTAKRMADFDGPLFDSEKKGYTLELLGKEVVDGTPAYKIKVKSADGDSTIFLDAEKFLEFKELRTVTTDQGAELTVESTTGDYKPVGKPDHRPLDPEQDAHRDQHEAHVAKFIHVVLRLPSAIGKVLLYAKVVLAALTGNPRFPNASTLLAVLDDRIQALEKAMNGGSAADRRAAREAVRDVLAHLCDHVQGVAEMEAGTSRPLGHPRAGRERNDGPPQGRRTPSWCSARSTARSRAAWISPRPTAPSGTRTSGRSARTSAPGRRCRAPGRRRRG